MSEPILLSEHFSLSEATRNRRGLPNIPGTEELKRMQETALTLLEPIRVMFGVPVDINSFYRDQEVNRIAGGDKNSAHMYGRAADIVIRGERMIDCFHKIKESIIPYDKIIYETNRIGSVWIHIQIHQDGMEPRRIALTSYEVWQYDTNAWKRFYDKVL